MNQREQDELVLALGTRKQRKEVRARRKAQAEL
jgi:hypothetical protein